MNETLAAERGIPSLVWGPGQQRRLDMIVKQVGLCTRWPLSRALVDGCGVGQYAVHLAPYFTHVVGIDIEPAHLQQARNRHPDLLLSRNACEQLPLPDSHFDLVVSHEVLEHVVDDRQAVAEMVRVVKPRGHIVLFLPNRWFPFETHGFFLDGRFYWGNIPLINYLPRIWRNRLAPHVRTYDAPAVHRLYRGLPVHIEHWTQIWPGFDALGTAYPGLNMLAKSLRHTCEHSRLRIIGLSHFLVLRRLDARVPVADGPPAGRAQDRARPAEARQPQSGTEGQTLASGTDAGGASVCAP